MKSPGKQPTARHGTQILSKYREIFDALCAPFKPEEVKSRPQGGRKLAYITARTAMNRLDNVLGPENWSDEYFPNEHSVLCKLTIRLPDGSILAKMDAGGHAGMQDQGDDDKSAFSDSFKRACVKFGVGRYLYGDGVPELSQTQGQRQPRAQGEIRDTPERQELGTPQRSTNPANFKIPNSGKAVYAWAMEMEKHFQTTVLDKIRSEAAKLGHRGRITEIPPETSYTVCLNTIKFLSSLPNYQGEFDDIIARENKGIPDETLEEIKHTRKQIIDSIKSTLSNQLNREPNVYEMRISFVHYATMDGEAPASLQECYDLPRLKQILGRILTAPTSNKSLTDSSPVDHQGKED